jgi:predicted ATPase
MAVKGSVPLPRVIVSHLVVRDFAEAVIFVPLLTITDRDLLPEISTK